MLSAQCTTDHAIGVAFGIIWTYHNTLVKRDSIVIKNEWAIRKGFKPEDLAKRLLSCVMVDDYDGITANNANFPDGPIPCSV